jgi:hypothetical protein
MPLIPQRDFDRAKKRMQMGCTRRSSRPSSVASSGSPPRPDRTSASSRSGPARTPAARVPPRRSASAAGRTPSPGQQFRTYLQGNAETGGLPEVHVYGSGRTGRSGRSTGS